MQPNSTKRDAGLLIAGGIAIAVGIIRTIKRWPPSDQQHPQLVGDTMEDVWNSLGAQIILGSTDGSNLDQRIAIRNQISRMESEEIWSRPINVPRTPLSAMRSMPNS